MSLTDLQLIALHVFKVQRLDTLKKKKKKTHADTYTKEQANTTKQDKTKQKNQRDTQQRLSMCNNEVR